MNTEDGYDLTEALRDLALERGWDYADFDPALLTRWRGAPFGREDAAAVHVVTGQAGGAPVLAFEYWVGQDAQWLVVAVPLPAGLPRFSLVPRQDPVDDEPFGYEFETEDADLGRRYVVYAADGDVAAGVLHLDAVQVLRTHRTLDWRVEGRDLLAVETAARREYGPDDIQATIDALARIAAGIPAELFGRYEPVPAYPPPLGPVAPRVTEATPAIPAAPAVPATPPADPLAALRDTTPW